MNRISLLAVAMCSLAFAACGGGDDGGKDGVVLPDAKMNPGADAPPAMVDAPPATTASEGIGKVCTAPTDCPTTAPDCVRVGTVAFCSATCGSTPEASMMPPAAPNGTTACRAVTPAPPSGTVGCFLTAPPMNGMKQWECAIACGTFDNMGTPVELGACPSGLTCTMNLCQ